MSEEISIVWFKTDTFHREVEYLGHAHHRNRGPTPKEDNRGELEKWLQENTVDISQANQFTPAKEKHELEATRYLYFDGKALCSISLAEYDMAAYDGNSRTEKEDGKYKQFICIKTQPKNAAIPKKILEKLKESGYRQYR